METILLTRSSVMWHTHSITAHGENILVWDDVLYGFLLGVESSYSLVIAKHCYIHTYTYTLVHTYPMPLLMSSATYVKILHILCLQKREDWCTVVAWFKKLGEHYFGRLAVSFQKLLKFDNIS